MTTEIDTTHSSARTGVFVALEGGDGAGKSTLAAQVADMDYASAVDRLSRGDATRGLVWVSRRQVSRTSDYAARVMEQLAITLWGSGDDPVLSDGFWAATQAAFFTAHSETVISPLLEAGFDVLVDGWLGKFTAQLLGQSYTAEALAVVFERVCMPDTCVLLEIDPETAWSRGRDFRPSELGMHTGAADLGRESFLDYQRRTAVTLRRFAAERGWQRLQVPDTETVADTAARLAPIITAARTGITPPAAPSTAAAAPLTGGPGTDAGARVEVDGPHYRWPAIDDSVEKAVVGQLHRSLSDRDSSGVIGGFEAAFAAFVGAEYAVSFASGTAAIHAMGRIAGLRPGDEVVAPAYTFLATASPFAFDGMRVRFADADPATGNLTAATIAEALTPATRAVIVTHMWGIPCRMDEITALCRDRGLILLEDCSHAHFASWAGRRVGTFGDMAAFSCNQKAITTGEGGVLVTGNRTYRDKALLFGHYNKRCLTEIDPAAPYYPYAVTGMGLKERITTLGAALGVHQLDHAGEIEDRRRAILDRYTRVLADNPVIAPVPLDPQARHGLYVLGLRFDPAAATVSRTRFVQMCRDVGAREVDVPGSTGDISAQPLFARTDPFAEWTGPAAMPTARWLPGVTEFAGRFLKLPLWGYDGDQPLVDGYLRVLQAVAEQVAR